MIINLSHLSTAGAAKVNPKNTGDNDSPAGDFSAQLSKLFNQAHSSRSSSSTDAAASHETKHSRSSDRDSSSDDQRRAADATTSPAPAVPQAAPQLPEARLTVPNLLGADTSASDSTQSSSTLPVESAGVQATAPPVATDSSLPVEAAGQTGVLPLPTVSNPPAVSAPADDDTDSVAPAQADDASTPALQTSPVNGPAASTDAAATLLATTQAATPAAALPADNNPPAITSSVVARAQTPLGKPIQADATPAPAHKTDTRVETTVQPAAQFSSQGMVDTLAKTAQPAVTAQNHSAPVNPAAKSIASKQDDKTENPVTFDRDASLQNSLQSEGSASLLPAGSNNFSTVDNASAKQGDNGSADSDRRTKDDAVAAITSAATPVTSMQSLSSTLHLADAPSTPSVQEQPVAVSSSSFAGNNAAVHSELEASPSADVKSVINTSKLIQTLNQSEMRVGMRSSDFGDISIRTSATHDNLITQISLDHAELAKSLATHIPELQTRLAAQGNHEVRINANDQNTGTASTMADARSGSNGRQQDQTGRSYLNSSYGTSSSIDSALPTAALANSLQNVQMSGRLDIQA